MDILSLFLQIWIQSTEQDIIANPFVFNGHWSILGCLKHRASRYDPRPRESHCLSEVGAGRRQGTVIESNYIPVFGQLNPSLHFFTFSMAMRNFFGKLCSRIWNSSVLCSNHKAVSTVHLDRAVSCNRNTLAIKIRETEMNDGNILPVLTKSKQ